MWKKTQSHVHFLNPQFVSSDRNGHRAGGTVEFGSRGEITATHESPSASLQHLLCGSPAAGSPGGCEAELGLSVLPPAKERLRVPGPSCAE